MVKGKGELENSTELLQKEHEINAINSEKNENMADSKPCQNLVEYPLNAKEFEERPYQIEFAQFIKKDDSIEALKKPLSS